MTYRAYAWLVVTAFCLVLILLGGCSAEFIDARDPCRPEVWRGMSHAERCAKLAKVDALSREAVR